MVQVIRELGVTDADAVASSTVKAGVFSSLLMALIYLAVTVVGAQSRGLFATSENGGIALAQIARHYLGSAGLVILAATVTLACLKTSVGLITSCAETFCGMFPKGPGYRAWAVLFTLISFALSNFGLSTIISYSVPVLMFLYPLAIALVLLALAVVALSVLCGFGFFNIKSVVSNIIYLLVIALLFGCGVLVAGEKGKPFATFISSFNEVTQTVMSFILRVSPIGVFCLMSWVVAAQGPKILGSLGLVLLAAYIGYIIHTVLVYSLSVKVFAGMSPLKFFKGILPAAVFAFTSTSSVASLPVSKECCDEMGVEKDISSFVLPLGATINMDGTAIYQAVAAVFIACCYGIELTLGDMAMIVLTATLASVGTAGTPGAGMIMLAMVLTQVNIPVAGIALIAGVDKLFDMGRTTLNITGDATCALWISRLEREKRSRQVKANK